MSIILRVAQTLVAGFGYCIVVSLLGAPCFGGLGGCFLWGRNKIVVWKWL